MAELRKIPRGYMSETRYDAYVELEVCDFMADTLYRYWFYTDGTAGFAYRGLGRSCFWTDEESWDRTYEETIKIWEEMK